MKKWEIRNVISSATDIIVVEADTGEQALDFWDADKNIVSRRTVEHDDGYLDIKEMKED